MTCLRCVRQQGNHDIYAVPDDMFGLYVDCRYNGGGDWWWGYPPNAPKAFAESPLEKRILATVAWTVGTYGIDSNRVYLCGNSMGASDPPVTIPRLSVTRTVQRLSLRMNPHFDGSF